MKLNQKYYKTAKLCKKYNYIFYNNFSSEENVSKHKQSYIHFVKNEQQLVSAKCLATEWLIKDIKDNNLTLFEYFAGAGVSSIIFNKTMNINYHEATDFNQDCVNQLKKMKIIHKAYKSDFRKIILKENKFDIKVLDFPYSSILQTTRGDWNMFGYAFSSEPKYLIWTDTARTYPLSIHKKKYEKILNDSLNDYEDYFEKYSNLLFQNYRYRINKVAWRGKNANYILASKQNTNISHKMFELNEKNEGFQWIT
jgi:hypothetical protein